MQLRMRRNPRVRTRWEQNRGEEAGGVYGAGAADGRGGVLRGRVEEGDLVELDYPGIEGSNFAK